MGRKLLICPFCCEPLTALNYHCDCGEQAHSRISKTVTLYHCGRPMTGISCPHCNAALPSDLRSRKQIALSVIGAKNAGKTHYITVLLSELRRSIGGAFGLGLMSATDSVGDKFLNEYYKTLYTGEKKRTIDPTASLLTEGNVSTLVSTDRIPLVYKLNVNKKGFFSTDKHYLLTIYDIAGEDLDNTATIKKVGKHLKYSDGLIFLLDPMQLTGVRQRLKSEGADFLPNEDLSGFSILERVYNVLCEQLNVRKIKIPMAGCFSKIDVLRHTFKANSCFNKDDSYSRHFKNKEICQEEFQNTDSEIASMLTKFDGEHILNDINNQYVNRNLFGLSALGCQPVNGQFNEINPYRVEDPFLWILRKNKFL